MFAAMKTLESKALLGYKLALDASFLQKEQIEEIIHWFNGSAVKVQDLELVVITEAKEFSKYASNQKIGFKHSWAGEKYYRQSSYLILGDVEIGKKVEIEYYDNGNYAGKDMEEIAPNFSIDQIQVVYLLQKNYSNYNGQYADDDTHLLVIYNPVEGYKICPEIQYILDNFKIQ